MQLSEKLKELHNSGDFGLALSGLYHEVRL